MDANVAHSPAEIKDGTTTARTSDRELVITRTFNGPVHLVFKAWTTPELLMRWWAPASFGISSSAARSMPAPAGATASSSRCPVSPSPSPFSAGIWK